MTGILGKKLGMMHFFTEEGHAKGVTAIEAGPCFVTQVKAEEKHGYNAIQLGFVEVKRLNSPENGHLKRAGRLLKHIREFRSDDVTGFESGQKISVSIFSPGDFVDVTGISKGKGFAGGVKRYHFGGGPKTHGQSDRHRAPGSIGSTTYPGRVIKGTRMAGHMGNHRVTVKNLKVAQVDPDRNLLLVNGGVPGAVNGILIIRKSARNR